MYNVSESLYDNHERKIEGYVSLPKSESCTVSDLKRYSIIDCEIYVTRDHCPCISDIWTLLQGVQHDPDFIYLYNEGTLVKLL